MAERFDIERLRAALHGLGQPPSGPGWNRAQLADVLPDSARLAPAAVLVGIVEHEVPTVLLTRRTENLATHAGQISFPGGRIDPGDADAIAAALREADEEVGLGAGFVSPLGYLDPFETISAGRSGRSLRGAAVAVLRSQRPSRAACRIPRVASRDSRIRVRRAPHLGCDCGDADQSA